MQTPSYLWFLTSMLVGGFLQIALWEIRAKWVIAVFLYIIGTLLNSYQFLLPQLRIVDIYYDVFLTSRNGLFFAFPLMVVGILCRKSKHGPHSLHVSLISLCCAVILFCIEVSLVMNHASNDQDTSMYFTIPLVTFCLVNTLINLNSYFNAALGEVSGCAKFWRYSSMVIYVVQFGLIMLFAKLENIFGIYSFWLTWVLVITTSLAIARLTHRTRLQQLLF